MLCDCVIVFWCGVTTLMYSEVTKAQLFQNIRKRQPSNIAAHPSRVLPWKSDILNSHFTKLQSHISVLWLFSFFKLMLVAALLLIGSPMPERFWASCQTTRHTYICQLVGVRLWSWWPHTHYKNPLKYFWNNGEALWRWSKPITCYMPDIILY